MVEKEEKERGGGEGNPTAPLAESNAFGDILQENDFASDWNYSTIYVQSKHYLLLV